MRLANKFTYYTLAFLIALTLILNFEIGAFLKKILIESNRSYVVELIQTHARKELAPQDFSFQEPSSTKREFQQFFKEIRSPNIVRIKVWDRYARVIFSNDESIIGQSFPDNEEFKESILGKSVIEIQKPIKAENTAESKYSQLMEVYVPVFLTEERNDKEVIGVIEVYLNLDHINTLLIKARIYLGIFISLAIFSYWLVLFFLFKNIVQKPVRELQKFKLAVESASDHIVITDENGIILYANKSAEKITGYSQKEMIGARPSLWGKKMPNEFYEKLWKTVKFDKIIFKDLIENQRKNGERYLAEVTIAPILNDSGNVIFFIGVERDVTKEKEIEKARLDFLSLASHQLRTPLSGTKWLIETINRGTIGQITQKQKEYINKIYQLNERMIKLVFDMLNVIRIESGAAPVKKKTISVSKIGKEIRITMEAASESKEVIFKNFLENRNTTIETDDMILRNILESFVSNAVIYSKPGQEIVLDMKEESAAFIFFVKDNGIGIPKEEQKRILEKFYRASNAKNWKPEGTGLGLYIAAMLAKKLGAEIFFESEENKGSTFYLRIPKKVG